MNIIIGVFLIILGTFIGYKLSEKYTKRRKFFSDFFEFNQTLKTEITFSNNTVNNILTTNHFQ